MGTEHTRATGTENMPESGEDKIHAPWSRGGGETSASGLSTGGQGVGVNATDTGGLDAAGNELGAAESGGRHGLSEGKREDEAQADAAGQSQGTASRS